MHAEVPEHRLQLVVEPVLRLLVVGRVGQPDLAVARQRHPVVGRRQVLGRQPEVDRVGRDVGQREHRRELGLERLLALEHLGVGLADHLDVAHRELEVLRARSRSRSARASSGTSSGSVPWRSPGPPRCCGTCSSGRPGPEPLASPFGWRSLADASRILAELAAPAETTTMSASYVSSASSRSTIDPLDGGPGRVRLEPGHDARGSGWSRSGARAPAGRRASRRRTWPGRGTGSRRRSGTGCSGCWAGRPRAGGRRRARGTGG